MKRVDLSMEENNKYEVIKKLVVACGTLNYVWGERRYHKIKIR